MNTIDASMTPSASDAKRIVGSRSIRPMTAAASARTRIVGPSTLPIGSPTIPARRKMATVASTVATTHTIVWSRFTGTPSSAARSEFSALRADGDADVGVAEERDERGDDDRHDDHGDDFVALEHHLADR